MPDLPPRIVGVRFFPSDRVHFYATEGTDLRPGDLVNVETSAGPATARIAIAPGQILAVDPDLTVAGTISPRR